MGTFFAGEIELSFFNYKNDEANRKIPSCFHELGAIEFKSSWSRFYIDLGTADELALDIFINMLTGFSKDFKPILQIIIGGDNSDWHRPNRYSRVKKFFDHIKKTG